jgi:hypothetical protein
MAECEALESIDTTPLKALRTVGDAFIARCVNLLAANLSGLVCLKSAGHSFISDCPALESIDTTTLKVLMTVSDNFLANCSRLKSNLGGLGCLETAGYCFLALLLLICFNVPPFNRSTRPLFGPSAVKHSSIHWQCPSSQSRKERQKEKERSFGISYAFSSGQWTAFWFNTHCPFFCFRTSPRSPHSRIDSTQTHALTVPATLGTHRF